MEDLTGTDNDEMIEVVISHNIPLTLAFKLIFLGIVCMALFELVYTFLTHQQATSSSISLGAFIIFGLAYLAMSFILGNSHKFKVSKKHLQEVV